MSAPHSDDRVETVVEKAEFVESCLEVLAAKQSLAYEEYRNDREQRDVVERRFEKMTQACLDVARMLLKDLDGSAPNSNAAAMYRLGEHGVLSDATGEKMAEAALFRNVLAHEYGEVLDHDVVYDALQDLRRYRDFLFEVRAHLEDVGAL